MYIPTRILVLFFLLSSILAGPALADEPSASGNHGRMKLTMIGQLGGQLSGLAISEDGQYAYVGVGSKVAVLELDLAPYAMQEQVGLSKTLVPNTTLFMHQMAANGDTLLIIATDANHQWYAINVDVSDNQSPIVRGYVNYGRVDKVRLAVGDPYWATMTLRTHTGKAHSYAWSEIDVFDYVSSEPMAEFRAGTYGSYYEGFDLAWVNQTPMLMWQDDYDQNTWLTPWDITDLDNPMEGATVQLPTSPRWYDNGALVPIDNTLWAVTPLGMVSLDVTDPLSPAVIAEADMTSDSDHVDACLMPRLQRMVWWGNAQLRVYDTMYRQTPELAWASNIACWSVASHADILGVIDSAGLAFRRIRDDGESELVGVWLPERPLTGHPIVCGDSFLLTSEECYLQTIDVSTPESMSIADTLDVAALIDDYWYEDGVVHVVLRRKQYHGRYRRAWQPRDLVCFDFVESKARHPSRNRTRTRSTIRCATLARRRLVTISSLDAIRTLATFQNTLRPTTVCTMQQSRQTKSG